MLTGRSQNEYFRADTVSGDSPQRERIHEGMVGDAIGTTKKTIAIKPEKRTAIQNQAID